MLILSLETSTEAGSCALWFDGLISERRCPAGQPHSETLLPLVRELLAEADVTVSQLDAIAFGMGPGAFTGLRVACGAAQGLAIASNRPVIPVGSLDTIAAMSDADRVLAVLDARMGEVYAGRFVRSDDLWLIQGDIRVSPPGEVVLPEDAGWLACGNALSAYPALAQRLGGAGIELGQSLVPDAATVARLAAGRMARGDSGIDAALAAPFYVRDKVAKTVAERLGEGGRA